MNNLAEVIELNENAAAVESTTKKRKSSSAPAVYAAMNAIQKELCIIGIAKNNKNTQQGYKFRGIDDIYNTLSPLLAKHGVCFIPRVLSRTCERNTSAKGTVLFYSVVEVEFDLVSISDGSKHIVKVFGEAMDSADKSTNKAMSAAYKYAAIQVFGIPTEGDNDADFTTPDEIPAKISEFDRLSAKLREANALIHLERIWKKHWREISALPEFDKIESLKNELKAEFESAIAAKQKAAQPAEPERITADQLDRIREIIKSGGTGSKVLTELERENLCSFANDPYSQRIDAEAYLSKIKSLIVEREDILMFEELHAAEQQRESELAEGD